MSSPWLYFYALAFGSVAAWVVLTIIIHLIMEFPHRAKINRRGH